MDALTLPSSRDEAWRWSDLDTLRTAAATVSQPTMIDPASLFLDLPGPRLTFIDGAFEPAQSQAGPVDVTRLEMSGDHALGQFLG